MSHNALTLKVILKQIGNGNAHADDYGLNQREGKKGTLEWKRSRADSAFDLRTKVQSHSSHFKSRALRSSLNFRGMATQSRTARIN